MLQSWSPFNKPLFIIRSVEKLNDLIAWLILLLLKKFLLQYRE